MHKVIDEDYSIRNSQDISTDALSEKGVLAVSLKGAEVYLFKKSIPYFI